MIEWISRLDSFLSFNEYDLLKDSGKVSSSIAKKLAETQYEKFRTVQDKEYKSDFDRMIHSTKISDNIPKTLKTGKKGNV
ncbi:RhuM family protein [Chryseobacterium hagamense]|uniref:Virulence protein n=1 Tax=Chryseobacterium hagamense TaxID=395935 RepID=A0A511YK89_9FLAO|nr:RhuM family protein [Chryseobacterium hagamense]GEN75617.1 hypothetical protein CHA01nite_13570 [Chryseobacterium hagamense]